MSSLHGRELRDLARASIAASLYLALMGCVTSNSAPTSGFAPSDAMNSVRNADFSARFPVADESDSSRTKDSSQPLIFPGSDTEPEPQRDRPLKLDA